MATSKMLREDGEKVGSDFKQDCRWDLYRLDGEIYRLQPSAEWVYRATNEVGE